MLLDKVSHLMLLIMFYVVQGVVSPLHITICKIVLIYMLNYLCFIVAPKITSPMNDIKIRCGQVFHVDINYIGEPSPDVTWTLERKPVVTDERTTVSAITNHTIVHTVNTKRTDSGEYVLKLKNEYGSDEGSFKLIVLGKINTIVKPKLSQLILISHRMLKFYRPTRTTRSST